MRDRINERWMRAGVSIIDPATTMIGVGVTLEADAVDPSVDAAGGRHHGGREG